MPREKNHEKAPALRLRSEVNTAITSDQLKEVKDYLAAKPGEVVKLKFNRRGHTTKNRASLLNKGAVKAALLSLLLAVSSSAGTCNPIPGDCKAPKDCAKCKCNALKLASGCSVARKAADAKWKAQKAAAG